MDREKYMKLCGKLVEVHETFLKDKQYEKELREQVLEHSDGSDIEMGKYTITFASEIKYKIIEEDKLKYELKEKFGLSEGNISWLMENVTVEKAQVRHIVIKQTANMKPKTKSAQQAA